MIIVELDQHVTALIAQALDDIEEHRLSVEEALRAVAEAAWIAGREAIAGSRAEVERIGPDDPQPDDWTSQTS